MLRLHHLSVAHFAGIGTVEVEFGPGLNVLYGPNDLGKSTIAKAIRMALLLPSNSTHAEEFVPWGGGGEPAVKLTFTAGEQRIYRVHKQFGRGGSSVLEESRNGVEFAELARGRGVEAVLRDLLRWGIPEPGGGGAQKGLPDSFLATALLSPQSGVSEILGATLAGDKHASGKEQIAAALEALAEDPLLKAILGSAQEHKESAYSPTGRKRTNQGSPFVEAARRVHEAQEEVDKLRRLVDETQGAEQHLRELMERRGGLQEKAAAAGVELEAVETLARQTEDRASAAGQLQRAQQEVARIRGHYDEAETSKHRLAQLDGLAATAAVAMEAAQQRRQQAEASLEQARHTALAEGADPAYSDSQLLLQINEAQRGAREAEQTLATIQGAQQAIDAVRGKEQELRKHEPAARKAIDDLARAEGQEQKAEQGMAHNERLKRALDLESACRQVKAAEEAMARRQDLETRMRMAHEEGARLARERVMLTVPAGASIAGMRQLQLEWAAARATLEVGLVATFTPLAPLEVNIQADSSPAQSRWLSLPLEIEANATLEATIPGMVSVQVRTGRREQQQRAAELERRWEQEVAPHLQSAGVVDLDGLDGKLAEARGLDNRIEHQEHVRRSLEQQITSMPGVAEVLAHANAAADALRLSLPETDLEALTAAVRALGPHASTHLDRQQRTLKQECDQARDGVTAFRQARILAEARRQQLERELTVARHTQDAALASFPQGIDAALRASVNARDTCRQQEKGANQALTSLKQRVAERERRNTAADQAARQALATAERDLQAAIAEHGMLLRSHSAEEARLKELVRQRDAADLPFAEGTLLQAKQSYESLPQPSRAVTAEEVVATRNQMRGVEAELGRLEREIYIARGRLEQVGGAVARERLRDAEDALALARQLDIETEASCEAWKLLFEQLKEADAAQASNLGLVLSPAIAGHFTALTRQRYDTVRLTAQLATEGVVVAGEVRDTGALSVGTREQLSTLFRLALAEYLKAAIVLDDQLVQSDSLRMQWFRSLLYEKAQQFQVVVLTCRPEDYLPADFRVPPGSAAHHLDLEGHPVRGVDLGQALRRGGDVG